MGGSAMRVLLRLPKPQHLLHQLAPGPGPDAALWPVVVHLAERYQLGEVREWHPARRSSSLNVVVATSQGRYVFRQHLLSEETVAHEYQVLGYLERQGFPAPRMCLDRDGRAWVSHNGAIYGVYEYVKGDCFTDFVWWPAQRREIIRQAGRTLAAYHRAVEGLIPTRYKWDAYQPTGNGRWRDGGFYRQALAEIRSLLQRSAATGPVDDFARARLDALERLIDLEKPVESCADLTRVVIHGDYAPFNILLRPDRSLFVLDYNAAHLDLRVFDVILATFWFAWRSGRLDPDRATAFQVGYSQEERLNDAEIAMAGDAFRWLMGRSIAERLRTHYLEQRFLLRDAAGLERFYQMCLWAAQHPLQLAAGLRSEAPE